MTGPDSDRTSLEPDRTSSQPESATPALEPEADGLTEPAPPSESDEATEAAASQGPLLGSIFTLEGRRAPGLYLVAWLLSVGGLVFTFVIGPMASNETMRPVLIGIGAFAVVLGLAAGAGSQILQRADRDPGRYRGPSPLLVFGAYFFAMSLVGLVLLVGLDLDPEQPFNFFAIGAVQVVGYLIAVWLFAVRSSALTWSQMGWPTWQGRGLKPTLRGVGLAFLVMLPVTFGLLIVGGVVGLLLGVDAPQVLPLSTTVMDGVLVTVTAAVLIPIGEELFFRGFALTAWLRDLGPRSALIRSSLFFALVHTVNISGVGFVEGLSQAVLQMVVLLPVAFVLGWLFLRYGMAGAISGHITYNSLLLSLAYLASKIPDPV